MSKRQVNSESENSTVIRGALVHGPLPVLLLIASVSACAGGSGPAETDSSMDENPDPVTDTADSDNTPVRPNILLIISDDQGLDATTQYALSRDTPVTPVLDQLAAEGLVFDNAWATPACTTTRGTLITGQFGVNSGIDKVPDYLDTTAATLQKQFDGPASDYRTAIIGKWHLSGGDASLSNHPVESGVDYYAGTLAGTIDDYFNWPLTKDGNISTSTNYHTSEMTDLAIDWIGDGSDPWFLWLAFVAPHSPFHLPPSDLHNRDLAGDAASIAANPRDYYLAAIEAMDTEIGRLLESLDATVRENTLIIFIGDNGTPARVIDTAAYTRTHSKGSLYEGGIKVPLIVSGAGVLRSNEREEALVNSVDLYPTILDLAGITPPDVIDGISFKEVLESTNLNPRQFNYAEFTSNNVTGWAVRDEQYKLIEFANGDRELYDLMTDADEVNNLWPQSSELDSRVTEMLQYALQII